MPPSRTGQLRGILGPTYSDEYIDLYADDSFIGMFFRKHVEYALHYSALSGFFVFEAETSNELVDIWAAINTVWQNRGSYASISAFYADINNALGLAGYTAPGGGPII